MKPFVVLTLCKCVCPGFPWLISHMAPRRVYSAGQSEKANLSNSILISTQRTQSLAWRKSFGFIVFCGFFPLKDFLPWLRCTYVGVFCNFLLDTFSVVLLKVAEARIGKGPRVPPLQNCPLSTALSLLGSRCSTTLSKKKKSFLKSLGHNWCLSLPPHLQKFYVEWNELKCIRQFGRV
jgi:hypothetical protein